MKKFWTGIQKFFADKKRFALCRMGLALLLALALTCVNGFAFVYQLGGAQTVTDGNQLAGSRYVSADIRWVMDVCGSETDTETGEALYYYAVAPLGNRFVLLRFDADRLADVTALEEETMNYLTGVSSAMSIHLPVSGMVAEAEPAAYSLLSQWFNNNVEWMSITGVVGDNPDAAGYLVNECILVDQVGSMGYTVSAIVSAAALLLVLYALGEGALLLTGYYRDSKIASRMLKKVKKEKEKAKEKLAAEKAVAAARAETEKIKAAAAELAELNAIGSEEPAAAAEPEAAVAAPEEKAEENG